MLQAQEDSGRRQESQPSVISVLKDFVDNAVLQVMVQMFRIEPIKSDFRECDTGANPKK